MELYNQALEGENVKVIYSQALRLIVLTANSVSNMWTKQVNLALFQGNPVVSIPYNSFAALFMTAPPFYEEAIISFFFAL